MKRRDILQAVGIGTAASVGMPTAAASSNSLIDKIEFKPADEETVKKVRSILESNQEVLTELEAEGLLERTDVDQFNYEDSYYPGNENEGISQSFVVDPNHEELNPAAVLSKKTGDGLVEIWVVLDQESILLDPQYADADYNSSLTTLEDSCGECFRAECTHDCLCPPDTTCIECGCYKCVPTGAPGCPN